MKLFNSPRDYIKSKFGANEINWNRSILDSIESSYKEHSYCDLFYAICLYKDNLKEINEFGVLGCYSIISMAAGSAKNNSNTLIKGFDLFEDYEFNSFKLNDAKERIKKAGFENISLIKTDVFKGDNLLKGLAQAQVVHIDLSNDGDIYEKILTSNLNKNLTLILEGGSHDRDENTWIKKYAARPIHPVLKKFSEDKRLEISIINAFPSLTIIENIA